jgi:hypothetical protein
MGMHREQLGSRAKRPARFALAALTGGLLAPSVVAQAGGAGDSQKQLEKQMRQYDAAWRLEVPADAQISERLLLDFGASTRAGIYSIDDEASNSHVLREYDGRAWLRADLDGVHRFYGRLKFTYDDWNHGDEFNPESVGLQEPIGERWWYQFDLRGYRQATAGEPARTNVDLKVGKQFVQFGSGLALSSALIAGQLEVEAYGVALDLLLGKTPPNDVVDFDVSRPSFDTNTKRDFYGALLEARGGSVVPYAYALVQRDHNTSDFTFYTDASSQLFPTFFAYDSEYFGGGFHGTLDPSWAWQSEFSLETGRALSSPIGANGAPVPQTEERVHAWAAELQLAWLARDARHTRTELECIVGSGDGDRLDSADTFGGNLSGTTDTAYNSLGFAQTGLALSPDPSNLVTTRLGTATSPFVGRGDLLDRLRLLADAYVFLKLDPNAPISVTSDDHRYVGTEIDLGVDWNLLSDVTLNLRAGFFIPGGAMPEGQDQLRKFLYGGVTYVF